MNHNVKQFLENNINNIASHDLNALFTAWYNNYSYGLTDKDDSNCLKEIFDVLDVCKITKETTHKTRMAIVARSMCEYIEYLEDSTVIRFDSVRNYLCSHLLLSKEDLLSLFQDICEAAGFTPLDVNGTAFRTL